MAASPNFVSGDHCQIIGQNNAANATMPGQKWSMKIDPKTKDVSNSRDGRKRIRGVTDAEGSFEVVLDTGTNKQPYDPANAGFYDGNTFVLQLYIDLTHFFQLTAIISGVTPSIDSFDGVAMYSVDFQLASGSITYPVCP